MNITIETIYSIIRNHYNFESYEEIPEENQLNWHRANLIYNLIKSSEASQ